MDGDIDQASITIKEASKIAEETNEQGGVEPLVLIAQAIIDFNQGNTAASLDNLKRLIEVNPLCPSDIWLALGVCYFKLNNYLKAKFSFEHTLNIDPENSMALTSLGITEILMNSSDPKQREKAVILFQRSFEIDDTNPLTMKHLAEHFFVSGDLDISEALSTRAIKYCEKYKSTLLGSDLNFILGKIQHQ
jgi:RNA polymerase-associated protein CTR9